MGKPLIDVKDMEVLNRRYAVLFKALRDIAGSNDATGRNPQLMVDTAIFALRSVGKPS